jgi:mannitol/fructose-specific phosphotransferase system IIA component (Ntr-type)
LSGEDGIAALIPLLKHQIQAHHLISKDEEIDVLDTMLASLVDLLEEKGVITQEEWEQKIKKRLQT